MSSLKIYRCSICEKVKAKYICNSCDILVCIGCVLVRFVRFQSYEKNDVEYIKVKLCVDCDKSGKYKPKIINGGSGYGDCVIS